VLQRSIDRNSDGGVGVRNSHFITKENGGNDLSRVQTFHACHPIHSLSFMPWDLCYQFTQFHNVSECQTKLACN
jgi:hypothetical protein